MKRIYIIVICLFLSSCASYKIDSQKNITVIIESDLDLNDVKNSAIEVFGCNSQYENCESLKKIQPTTLGPHYINVPNHSSYQFETTSVNCSHGAFTDIGDYVKADINVYKIKIKKYCNTVTTIKVNEFESRLNNQATPKDWGRTILGPEKDSK